MASKKITKTWWGEKWLNALNGVYLTNRIGRGKTYANTGRVYDIVINDNLALAKVKGNYQSYYNVSVEFKQFTQKEKNIIIKTVYDNPSITAALLNHKLPEELYELLLKNGVNVFPHSHSDLETSCNCPDYATICKHIAGLVYMIALEIDKDPFLIFKIQGLDLLDALNFEIEEDSVRDVSELFCHSDMESEGEIDFSKIPNLHEQIFSLLDSNPPFYKKDFKSILDNIYKSMPHLKREYENYTREYSYGGYNNAVYLDIDIADFKGDEEDFDEWAENVFLMKWGMPNQWDKFSINVNKDYKISKITTGKKTPFNKNKSEFALFGFFTELSESPVVKFNDDIKFLNLLYQFTCELIKKHALIPELFKSGDSYQIRWVPAFFDKTISDIISIISNMCPDDLIRFKNTKLSKKDQIITGVSLFFKGFLEDYLKYGASQMIEKNFNEKIFKLFFFNPQSFKKDLTTPEVINQWLSKFQINSRDYDLYLLVEESPKGFDIDIKVNEDMESINDVINTTGDKLLKTNLLKDFYQINEIYPRFQNALNHNEYLELNLDDFTAFFLNSLPLFEIMGIKIILPKSLNKVFRPKIKLDMEIMKNEDSYIKFDDLTKFNWKVAIGNTSCSIAEFKQLAEKSRGLVKIANEYVMLDEREVKSLIKQIDKLPEKLNKHELMKAMLSGEILDRDIEIEGNFDELIENITSIDEIEVPSDVHADLRPYQEKGYSWLVQNIKSGFGSILADDMGLGKTLQVLTAIQYCKQENLLEKEKVLVIAPTSLLTNWQEEINKFTPDLTSYIYHGQGRRFTKI